MVIAKDQTAITIKSAVQIWLTLLVFSCLSSVCENVRKMGYNYGKPRPIFKEAPENRVDILKKE